MDPISTKLLKDGAPVIAIHLANLITMSTKRDTLCKTVKIKPLFKKELRLTLKIIGLFLFCL